MREEPQEPWEALASKIYMAWNDEQMDLPMGGGSSSIKDWLGPEPQDRLEGIIADFMDERGIEGSTTGPQVAALVQAAVDELLQGWTP